MRSSYYKQQCSTAYFKSYYGRYGSESQAKEEGIQYVFDEDDYYDDDEYYDGEYYDDEYYDGEYYDDEYDEESEEADSVEEASEESTEE